MNLELVSWNGIPLTNFRGIIPANTPLFPAASPVWAERVDNFSILAGKRLAGSTLGIKLIYRTAPFTHHLRDEDVRRLFAVRDRTPRKLVAQDLADNGRLWSVMATPISATPDKGAAVVVLALVEPYWSLESTVNETWNITASGQTKTVFLLGELARPVFAITPTLAKGVGFMHYRFVDVQPPSTTIIMPDHPTDLSNGGIDTAALVTANKAQTSGADFRLVIDGVESYRWFGETTAAFNTAITKVWANVTWHPKVTLTLKNAMTDSEEVTALEVNSSPAFRTAFAKLPANGIVKIDSERFTYSGKDSVKLKLTGVKRAAKASAAGAHSAGATVTWIQHDIWFLYGNPTVSAPVQDDSVRPMLDLDASTNTSWVFTGFKETDAKRTAAWQDVLSASTLKSSYTYTGAQGNQTTTPATEAGMAIVSRQVNNAWKPETATLYWSLCCLAGVTHVASASGQKYRYATNWPTVTLNKSNDNKSLTAVATLATPGNAQNWEAWSIGNTPLSGSFKYIVFKLNGSIAGSANNAALVEMAAITLTLDASNVPVISVGPEASTYYLEATITNVTTGQAFTLRYPMEINKALTVDCTHRTVTYHDGTNALVAISLDSNRVQWMELQNGANILRFDDSGTAGVTIGIAYQEKKPL